jgi:hypothetical protein
MTDDRQEIINRLAYNFYQIRLRHDIPGDSKKDWLDAEKEYERYVELHNGGSQWHTRG